MEKFFFAFYKIKYFRNRMKLALILAFFLALSKSQDADSMHENLNQEILTLKNTNDELFLLVKDLIEKDNLLQNQI